MWAAGRRRCREPGTVRDARDMPRQRVAAGAMELGGIAKEKMRCVGTRVSTRAKEQETAAGEECM